jgi:translocation and assembly module TamB
MEEKDPTYQPAEETENKSVQKAPWVTIVRYLLTGILAAIALAILLVAGMLIALQTNWGAARALDFFVGLADPRTEAEIHVGEVRGNFITNISLRDIHVTDTLGRPYAFVDTLNLRYNLFGLFFGTIHFREIEFGRVDVDMRELPDGRWDLLDVLPIDTTEVDTTRRLFDFRLDRGSIREGNLTMEFYAPGRDSVFAVRGLGTSISDMLMTDDIYIRFDTLFADMIPPGLQDTVWVSTGGRIDGPLWTIEDTRLLSARSNVTAGGRFRYPFRRGATYEDVDFVVTAAPLGFRDVHVFWPDLPEQGYIEIDGRITGSRNMLDFVVDAGLSDGATLSSSGTITPYRDEPVRYALQGELRRFDPGFFTGAPPGEVAVINADFRFDVTGPSLQQVDGPVFVDLFNTRFGTYRLDRTVLDGRFVNGQARFDVNGGLRGARIVGTGTIRPFDDVIPYSLQGRFQNLNLARFEVEETTDLSGTLTLEGRGFDPETMYLNLTTVLGPSRINRALLTESRINILLDQGDLSYGVRLTGAGGMLTAQGTGDMRDPIAYTVSRGRMETFDLAALAGQPVSSRLTGSFSLSGRGTEPEMMIVRGDATLVDSRWDDLVVNRATGAFNLSRGSLRLTTVADVEGGHLDFSASLRPFDAVIPYTIHRGEFRNVNLAVLLDQPDLQTDLTGTIAGSGRGVAVPAIVFDGRVDLDESVINQQPIESASVVLDLRGGTLEYEGRVTFPDGLIVAEGTATPFADRPQYTIVSGRFENLNIGAFAGAPDWQTRLTGTIALAGEGIDPETLELASRLDLSPSIINRQLIRSAAVDLQVQAGTTRVQAAVDVADAGGVTFVAEGRFFDEVPTYAAQGTLLDVDVARFLAGDTLGLRLTTDFRVAGRGLDPETMYLEGQLNSREILWTDIRADRADASFVYDAGLLQIDSLIVRSNVVYLDGAGSIAIVDPQGQYPSDFSFRADIREPIRLAPILAPDARVLTAGTAIVEGRLFGPPGMLQFETVAHLENAIYNDIRVGRLEGRFAGLFDADRNIATAEMDAVIQTLSLPNVVVARTNLEGFYDGEMIYFLADSDVDARRDLLVDGRVDLTPGERVITLEQLNLRLDEDRFSLLQPATISFSDVYRVSNFLLFTEDQELAVDGVIDLEGEQSLVVTLDNFRLDGVSDLLGFDGLGGRVNGSLVLLGPAWAPLLEGTLVADMYSFRDPVGDLELTLLYDNLRLNLDAILEDEEGNQLTATGSIPMDLRLSPPTEEQPGIAAAEAIEGLVDIRILSNNFQIDWVLPFLDRDTVNRLEGRLTADIEVSGELDDPILDGEATIVNGLVGLPSLGLAYSDIQAQANLVGNQVVIERAQMRSGPGTMVASGTIDMPRLTLGEFNLALVASNFRVANLPQQYRTDVTGVMALQGTTQRPLLTGSLRLISSEFWVPDEFTEIEPVALTTEDVLMLERNFGVRVEEADTEAFDIFDAAAFNLSLTIERDAWLRSRAQPRMDIQFTGLLDISKEPFGDILAFGSVEVLPERSRVVQFGRRFDIETGALLFNGPILEAFMDVDAVYEVRMREGQDEQVRITLGLTGRLDDLSLTLSSEPTMDMTDIISYIATGRPASETFLLGGEGAGPGIGLDPAYGLALGQLTAFVEGVAAEGLGLDVIEIEQDGLRGARITAGKYVTNRLFTSVSYPIGQYDSGGREAVGGDANERKTRVTIEYEVFRWMLLRAMQRGSERAVHMLFEYSY